MFAPSLGRVARSTSSLSSAPVLTLGRAGLSTIRPSHQRRYSSSKSSIASKSALAPSSKKKPAQDVEHNAAPQLQGIEAGAKATDTAAEIAVATSMNNVPHVPPTTHISDADVHLSAFFALHRPLSFHREAWQPLASMDAFEAVFNKSEPGNARARTIEETRNTLSALVQQITARLDAHEEMQADAMFPMEPMEPMDPMNPGQYLDGPPTEEMIQFYTSRIPHFQTPPPPIAFDPFVMTRPVTEVALPAEPAERPRTFREHVHKRRGGMLLISVKRQRKLKMKKHKYKKLMKRTRLERRKLDRA